MRFLSIFRRPQMPGIPSARSPLVTMLAWAGAVSAWPQLPADEEGLRQLSERRDNANREYQLGRAAYERGDFKTAEPLFKRASEYAPEFPEPHFALSGNKRHREDER